MDSSENDRLLESLYRYITQELKFHCVIEVIPGLRGGFWDDRADGAASYTPNGIPQICLDNTYKTWPSERLTYVVCHELSHHKLGHVHKATRATAQRGTVYPQSKALVDYTQSIETHADAMAQVYVKRFAKWRGEQLLADLQAQVLELQQLLGIRR